MKRATIAITAALVAVMLAGTLASAASIDFGGSLQGNIIWRGNAWPDGSPKGLAASNALKLNIGLNAGGAAGKTKAVIQLKPWVLDSTAAFGGSGFSSLNPSVMVDKAYIETQGSFWAAGPEVTARLGNIDVAYSDYVANLSKDGATIDGLGFGPLGLSGFVAWDKVQTGTDSDGNPIYQTFNPMGIVGRGSFSGIDLGGVMVRADQEVAYAVDGKINVAPGVALTGVFAAETTHNASMLKADATMNPAPNMTLNAGYRVVGASFDPKYVARTYAGDGVTRTDWVGVNQGKAGFNVGLDTTQQGIHVAASYDDPLGQVKLAGDTTVQGLKLNAATDLARSGNTFVRTQTTFGAEKGLGNDAMPIVAKYQGTIDAANQLSHVIGAKVTLNAVPHLSGLAVEGNMRLAGGATNYDAHATYGAPNGVSLGAHYDTEGGKGMWVDAGVSVAF
ncbi:MAG: hypothetical protein HYY08_04505 [Firmicutes bacterium]|nr:hypothetical protein [Bacillota bacterium]